MAAVASGNVNVTGRRVVAIIIDGILISIVVFVMSSLFGSTSAGGGSVSASVSGIPAIISIVIAFLYFMLMEGALGQTVGKMLLGIEVVREGDDQTPGMGSAALRTLLRAVDSLPFAYLVGFIVVLVSGKNQRIGDMVANTLVVRKGSAGGSSRVA